MADSMTAAASRGALAQLGRALRDPAAITLGGSAALLTGHLDRLTDDGDVVESTPDFGTLLDAARRVEAVEQAPPGWLNASVQAYTHVLPPDHRTRLVRLPRVGRLDVALLGRADVVLMKTYAGRPRDLEDLLAVRPTEEELRHVEARLPLIAEREPEKAAGMRGVVADLRRALARRQAGDAGVGDADGAPGPRTLERWDERLDLPATDPPAGSSPGPTPDGPGPPAGPPPPGARGPRR